MLTFKLDEPFEKERTFQELAMFVLSDFKTIRCWDTSAMYNFRPGFPDIIVCGSGGKFIALELKARKGSLTRPQSYFRESVEKIGGIYVVCRTLDDVMNAVGGFRDADAAETARQRDAERFA